MQGFREPREETQGSAPLPGAVLEFLLLLMKMFPLVKRSPFLCCSDLLEEAGWVEPVLM